MLRKLFLIFFIGALLSACGSRPERNQGAEVEERTVGADADADEQAAEDSVQSFGLEEDQSAALRQLEDPQSPLSVRIIYFDYDSNAILPQFNEAIRAHAEFLQAHPNMVATLEGHADERGSREYNLALGERRALAVKQQLVLLGASAGQVRAVSYGEERPAATGRDQEAWALNRRVEFVY